MNIKLELVTVEDAKRLYYFEKENKDFFETMVPSRGEEYYLYDYFLEQLGSLLEEQTMGLSYFYLIKNTSGEIVGRINLVDIENSTGHLGYRVGERFLGLGVATQAVRELVASTTIREIHAKTTSTNIASQRVLEKNHFNLISKNSAAITMNNQLVDFYNYLWKNKKR